MQKFTKYDFLAFVAAISIFGFMATLAQKNIDANEYKIAKYQAEKVSFVKERQFVGKELLKLKAKFPDRTFLDLLPEVEAQIKEMPPKEEKEKCDFVCKELRALLKVSFIDPRTLLLGYISDKNNCKIEYYNDNPKAAECDACTYANRGERIFEKMTREAMLQEALNKKLKE